MRSHYTAAALAALRLPGLPTTESAMKRLAKRQGWPFRERRSGKGGGVEYPLSALPDDARAALLVTVASTAPAPVTAPTIAASSPSVAVAAARVPATAAAGAVTRADTTALSRLHGWQRDRGHARSALLAKVDHIVASLDVSIDEALRALNETLAQGNSPELNALAQTANARPRKGRALELNRATYYRWKGLREDGGFAALAPKPTHYERIPDWAPYLFRLNTTNKLNKTHLHEQLERLLQDPETGYAGEVPSYRQVSRFIANKVGTVAWESGRRGPRDLKNVLPYVKRESPPYPDDVYLSDGHTFDAVVAHWDPKRSPIRPEITPVISASTRKIVGISFGIKEDKRGVLEAQRRAFTTHGVCAIWYVDRGPGFNNDAQHHELLGVAGRIGFTISHSLPYNSQARGLVERAHQSIFVRAAKELPSYVGKTADKEAKGNIYRIDRQLAKRLGRGKALPTWHEFVAFILKKVDEYNARSHGELDAVVWPDGKRRGMSPNMAWEAAKAKGWQPRLLSEEEARTLFRPLELRVVDRGVIRFDNKTYFNASLAEYHGRKVLIGYDWCDPSFVTVEEFETRRWLCDAHLDVHARPYFPESVLESTRRKSDEARLRRAQNKVDRLAGEMGAPAIENDPSPTFDWDVVDVQPVEKVAIEAPARPYFRFDSDRYEWLMQHRDEWRDEDRAFVQNYTSSETYALLREMYEANGIAWAEDKGKGFSAAG